MPIVTLKKRSEFQRVRGGGRWSGTSFVLEGKARPESASAGRAGQTAAGARFGFTVTKKIGGAVDRNRIKRRLRAALAELAGSCADPGYDYVVVARAPCRDQVFAALLVDLKRAFERVNAGASGNRRSSAISRIARPATDSDSKD